MTNASRNIAALLCILSIVACSKMANAPLLITENPVSVTPETLEKGQKLFHFHCAGCHGDTGEGMGPDAIDRDLPAPSLLPYVKSSSTNDIAYQVACGKKGMMPHFRNLLTDDELWQLSNYVSALADGKKQ